MLLQGGNHNMEIAEEARFSTAFDPSEHEADFRYSKDRANKAII